MTLALLLPSLALAAPLGAFETRLTASDRIPSDFYGSAVSLGDGDGDGWDDVAIGAFYRESVGAVYLYRGSAEGVSAATEQVMVPSILQGGDLFGSAAAGGADLDGDGFDDLVVGAPGDDENGDNAGAVYVYYGGSSGYDLAGEEKLISSPGRAGEYFGSVVAVGDVNGDGYDDVAVSSLAPDGLGGVSVFFGSAGGLDPASEVRIASASVSPDFGRGLAVTGDLTGDGYADLVIGDASYSGAKEYAGAVWVYAGGPAGIDEGSSTLLQPSDAAALQFFGGSVAAADVNGDSSIDLVVGAPGADENRGAAYVYYGSGDGIDVATETALVARSGQPFDWCGFPVVAADLNGDTFAEVVMGCRYDSERGDFTGAVYVHAGTSAGVDPDSQRKLTASDGGAYAEFGASLAAVGDTNGDGLGDLLVGASGDADYAGAAYLYSNSPGGVCVVDDDADGACAVDDCDDADPARYPDATDVPGDGIDQDCDGVDATEETDTDTDADADTDTDSDTDTDTDADPGADDSGAAKDSGGCGCASTPAAGAPWLFLLTFLAALRRARSPGASQ